MRKFTIFLLVVLTSISITKADYFSESVARFIYSPNFEQIEKIEDPKIKFCEEAFLDGYRRREFTEMENLICSDFFAQKIEDELNYKKQVLWERWIY